MTDRLRSLPLYRLADMREQLDGELFFSDGELTPEQERRFDAIAGSADKKIARIGLAILEAQAMAKIIEGEEERLAERRRGVLRDIERRKEYLRLQMERLGKTKVIGALCTVTLHGNSTLTVSTVATSAAGPQRDLFARPGSGSHQRRTERGNHIRVR